MSLVTGISPTISASISLTGQESKLSGHVYELTYQMLKLESDIEIQAGSECAVDLIAHGRISITKVFLDGYIVRSTRNLLHVQLRSSSEWKFVYEMIQQLTA